MPVTLGNRTFYRTSEVCRMASISRSTLLRWLKDGYLQVSEYRDRRSWRLFTKDDVEKFISEANRIYQAGGENN